MARPRNRYYAPTVYVDETPATDAPRLDAKYGICARCKQGATHFLHGAGEVTIFGCQPCRFAWPLAIRVRNPFAGYSLGAPLRPDKRRTLRGLRQHRAEINLMIASVQAAAP